jgi:hypothetical protein
MNKIRYIVEDASKSGETTISPQSKPLRRNMHKEEGVIKAPSFLRLWGRPITAVGQKWGKNGVHYSTV